MNRRIARVLGTTLLGACVLAGCKNSPVFVTPSPTASTAATQLASSRSIDFEVRAVSSLQTTSGKIVNADPAGLVAAGSGNLIAAGGGNLLAAAGGNLIAAGSGNFGPARTLAAAPAQSGFLLVTGAVVHFETLNGPKISNSYLQSDASGAVHVNNLPDGQPTLCIAQWKENGQVYRTSAIVNTGTVGGKVQLDPINHFLQARIRELVSKQGSLKSVSADQLKMAWSAFNDAGISPDASVLMVSATKSVSELSPA